MSLLCLIGVYFIQVYSNKASNMLISNVHFFINPYKPLDCFLYNFSTVHNCTCPGNALLDHQSYHHCQNSCSSRTSKEWIFSSACLFSGHQHHLSYFDMSISGVYGPIFSLPLYGMDCSSIIFHC